MQININYFINQILRKTVLKRRVFFLISDILLISSAMYISFWLRFDGAIPLNFMKILPYLILFSLIAKISFLALFNLYDISWRYASLEEMVKIFKAITSGSLMLVVVFFFFRTYDPFKFAPFPRSIILLDYMFSLFLIGFLRISKRLILDGLKGLFSKKQKKSKVLIIGAGSAGEQLVREMFRNKNSSYLPAGFIDDAPAKKGIKIHDVKVLGTRKEMPEIIKNNDIDEVVIAMPSAHSKVIREIVETIRETKLTEKIKILPSTTALIDGKVTLADIHKIKLEDLLGRTPVQIDLQKIGDFIKDKRIMVTGAGGSIGSELVKSIIKFNPKSLIMLDIDETELFYLIEEIKYTTQEAIPVIGDIKDKIKMEDVFINCQPQVIFHSAALKHVPILESFPEEAVKTNVAGTKVIAELSLKLGVEKFIFISTDKAINPTSIMGATKRACEEWLKSLNKKSNTKFISVRFGNVLGSRGSVIPIFEKQIKRGGPVTVTHSEMKRYFMVVSEAVLLVLEAAAIGEGGEVYVLDMGEPIKIIDLAREMIRLSGYEPDIDIPIIYSKIRPGEKLYEEILSTEEGTEATEYDKIFVAKDVKEHFVKDIDEKIDNLIKTSYEQKGKKEIIRLLKDIVHTYKPSKDLSLEDF